MTTLEVRVPDASAVSLARRETTALAAEAGFDELLSGQAALAATELATNLVKHGGGGRMLLNVQGGGIDLLALDEGPGMADIAACMADGYSTAGTPGNGLGAVRRLSSSFGVLSWPQRGTVMHARVGPALTGASARTAALVVPKPGELACGDGWATHETTEHRTLMVIDGLGHGTEAAVVAREAVNLFHRHCEQAPTDLLQTLHLGLRHTRGGAVAVARVHWHSQTITFAGLGNIAAAVVGQDGQTRRMVSHNGTAGHNARKIQSFEYPFITGALLAMHSDGLSGTWSMDRYPGALRSAPALIAGVLYRDQARGRDDATVVVSKLERP